MASINTILTAIGQALATDASIETFCQDQYGTSLTVRENYNARKDPGASDCPFAIVFPISKSGGHGQREKQHVIGIDSAVLTDDGQETVDNVVRYVPARNAEALRALIVDAVQTWCNSQDFLIEAAVTEYHLLDKLPFAGTGIDLVLVEKTTIGADPIE